MQQLYQQIVGYPSLKRCFVKKTIFFSYRYIMVAMPRMSLVQDNDSAVVRSRFDAAVNSMDSGVV